MQEYQTGSSIFHLVQTISRYVTQNGGEGMEELSLTNARILLFVKSNEMRDVYQKDVEKEFGITRSTASRVLMLMEQKGLLQRVGVKHDARLKKMVLTEKSEKLSEELIRQGRQVDRMLLKGFSDEEIATLKSFINRMTENVAEANS